MKGPSSDIASPAEPGLLLSEPSVEAPRAEGVPGLGALTRPSQVALKVSRKYTEETLKGWQGVTGSHTPTLGAHVPDRTTYPCLHTT